MQRDLFVPLVVRLGLDDLQAKDILVHPEHALQRLLVREKHAQLLGIDGELLLLVEILVIKNIPHVDNGIRVAGLRLFDLGELLHLGLPLRLEAALEVHQKVARSLTVAGHLDLAAVIGPRLVAEFVGDHSAELQHLFQQRNILVAGQHQSLSGKTNARLLHLRAAQNVEIMKRHIGLQRVLVVAGFDLLEERLRQPLELSLGELK